MEKDELKVNLKNYKEIKKAKIKINNNQNLVFEFVEKNGKYLKVTKLNEKKEIDYEYFIHESDLILLHSFYLFKKHNNEPIF